MSVTEQRYEAVLDVRAGSTVTHVAARFGVSRQAVGCPGAIPSRITVHRILVRHGLVDERPRRRRREDYVQWERDRPMELWQRDIVSGVFLVDGSEAKVVTGADDHSRYCVIAAVVPKANGRAVCLALVAALREYGIPEELLTDSGKQFTARFNAGGGEVMFDRISRERHHSPAH